MPPPHTSGRSGTESESEGNDRRLLFNHRANRHPSPLAWMVQSPLNLRGLLHDMPRHSEKHLPKFDSEKGTSADDHINNFYLSLQMMKVQYNGVACCLFPHTLENKATWYRSLPISSIQTWDEFRKSFLDKFSDDKTPSILLTELSTLKCNKKENVNDFNQRVTTILNKFPMDVALDDSITIDYYTRSLP